MAVGDLNFCGNFEKLILADPGYPWVNVKPVLEQATILMGNLEVPFCDNGRPYLKKTWVLKADPRTVQALVVAGFDLVTLANNHIMDFGPRSLEQTLKTLRQAKIKATGAGRNQAEARQPAFIKTPSGVTLAFLAYSTTYPAEFWATSNRPGTAYGKPAVFLADIKAARAQADHVIVSFHWSNELQTIPADYQLQYARQCINAGAALVVGHHPHVLQGIETYNGGLIAYSLGNFAFGSLTTKVKDSIILTVNFNKTKLLQATVYPLNVQNYEVRYQPRLRVGADAVRVLHDLQQLSAPFHTTIKINNGVGTIHIAK